MNKLFAIALGIIMMFTFPRMEAEKKSEPEVKVQESTSATEPEETKSTMPNEYLIEKEYNSRKNIYWGRER